MKCGTCGKEKPLPQDAGSVILATRVRGVERPSDDPFILRCFGPGWHSFGMIASRYDHGSGSIESWRPARVVTEDEWAALHKCHVDCSVWGALKARCDTAENRIRDVERERTSARDEVFALRAEADALRADLDAAKRLRPFQNWPTTQDVSEPLEVAVEALILVVNEIKTERDRLRDGITALADEWAASVDADDTAFEIVQDIRELLDGGSDE